MSARGHDPASCFHCFIGLEAHARFRRGEIDGLDVAQALAQALAEHIGTIETPAARAKFRDRIFTEIGIYSETIAARLAAGAEPPAGAVH